LRSLSTHPFFCPMVKADAYGHGAIEVAKTLVDEGANTFGVALVEEAIILRQAGLDKIDILVFQPVLTLAAAQAAAEYDLSIVISSWATIKVLEQLKHKRPISVHLKFNTGMNRLGFSLNEANELKKYFVLAQSLKLVGVCSHLAAGEDFAAQDSVTQKQLECLRGVAKIFDDKIIHILNSSGLLSTALQDSSQVQSWGARPGLALYGIKPEIITNNAEVKDRWHNLELRPVMSWHTQICHLQEVKKGEGVSYGPTFRAKKDMRIGVAGLGYADGYFRQLSNVGAMLCGGRRVPVSGTVCMDFTMLDISETSASFGEDIVVMGEQNSHKISAADIANWVGTNTYEVFTRVGSRVPRIYV